MYTLVFELNPQGLPPLSGFDIYCKASPTDLFVCVSSGRLGLLDYDEVELSNLHRQVLHGEDNQGQAKALSAASAVKRY